MTLSRRGALKFTLSATAMVGLGAAAATPKVSADGLQLATVNVKDYGANGDGTTDDTAAIHAARDAAGVGGQIVIPPGTYLVGRLTASVAGQTWWLGEATLIGPDTGRFINVSAKEVTIRGAGPSKTTLKSSSPDGVVELAGASDITIADLTVESTATGSSAIGIAASHAGLQKRVSITNCRIIGTTNNAVRFPSAVEGLTFTDNFVEDCAAGFTLYAPTEASGLISTQINLSRNHFRNVGSVNLQLYGNANNPGVSTIVGVEISGNDLRDFAQTGADGPIPIEPTGVTNIRIANNTIEGPATRGISTGNNVYMIITGNTIRGQSFYAFELNGGRHISIVGNTVENCATLAVETADPRRSVRLTDIVIANNNYAGSGRSSAFSTDAIHLRYARRARISANVFTDWQHLRSAVRIGDAAIPVPEDCVVEGHEFVISDKNTPLRTVHIRSAIRTTVMRNTLRISRDLVSGDNHTCAIMAQIDPQSAGTLIDGNYIVFTGSVFAAPGASGVGNNSAPPPAPCAGLTVRRNHIANGPRGLNLYTSSADLVVDDNATSTCAAGDNIPTTATVVRTQR